MAQFAGFHPIWALDLWSGRYHDMTSLMCETAAVLSVIGQRCCNLAALSFSQRPGWSI